MSALVAMIHRSRLAGARQIHSVAQMMNTNFVSASEVPSRIQKLHDVHGSAKMEFKASEEELAQINKYVTDRVASKHPGNVIDDDGQLRAVQGYSQGWNPSLMDRLASRALSLLGCDSVYVHQFRVNVKTPSKAAGSCSWSLHRDLDFWHGMDGMPTTNAVAFHVLVSEPKDTNGHAVSVDVSHREVSDAHSNHSKDRKAVFGDSALKYTVPEELIGEQPWSQGTVASMDPLRSHDSRPNTSLHNQVLLSVIFNDAATSPVQPEGKGAIRRPPHIVSQPMHKPNVEISPWRSPINIWKRKPAFMQPQCANFPEATTQRQTL